MTLFLVTMSCHAEQNQNLLSFFFTGTYYVQGQHLLLMGPEPTSKSLNYLHVKDEHLSTGRNCNKNIEMPL